MLEGKYNVHEDEVEDESNDLFTEAGWCQNFNTQVMASLEAVSSYDPRPYGQVRMEQAILQQGRSMGRFAIRTVFSSADGTT